MKAILIDGMNLSHRNHHRLATLATKSGIKTGLIFGFIQSLAALQKKFPTAETYVLWDTKSELRYSIYPEYKQRRKEKRDEGDYQELLARVADLKKILNYMNVTQVTAQGYEADDLAGYMMQHLDKDIVLVTADKDWLQLIDDDRNIRVLKPGKDEVLYSRRTFIEEFKYPPEGSVIFKCLKGDKSDNIKGIMRFPTKIAEELANRILNIEQLFIDKTVLTDIPEKWKQTIELEKETLRLNAKLVTLYGNIENVEFHKGAYNAEQIKNFYELFEFDSLLSKIKKDELIQRKRAIVQRSKLGNTTTPAAPTTKPKRFIVKR